MGHKSTEVFRSGNSVTYSLYHECEECDRHHNDHVYKTPDGKEVCPSCELKRLGKITKRKTYIIDGDTDQIIAVFNNTLGDNNFKDAVKSITNGKEVWWAMNNVTGKFSGDVYIVSKDLTEE